MSHKIIDCFIFYNEVNMLEYRLNLLWNVVDYFVICEASRTFIGNQKEYYLDNSRFTLYGSKIIQIKIDLPYPNPDISKNEQWLNESYQRDNLSQGIDYLVKNNKISNNDLIIINDVDEIPDPNTLIYLSKQKPIEALFTLVQKYHSYNLETVRLLNWYHVKVLSYNTLTNVLNNPLFSTIRMYNVTIPLPNDIQKFYPINIMNGGWHLSYFGDIKFIQNKINNFSHQEINITENEINDRINNGLDIGGNNTILYEHIKIEDNNYLPPNTAFLLYLFGLN